MVGHAAPGDPQRAKGPRGGTADRSAWLYPRSSAAISGLISCRPKNQAPPQDSAQFLKGWIPAAPGVIRFHLRSSAAISGLLLQGLGKARSKSPKLYHE
jgi:hypothetical protein